jgi:hypothetical protein
MLNPDYFKLLDILTIARSRKHIAKYYTGGDTSDFPTRLKPISLSPKIDRDNEMPPIADLNAMIAGLSFAQYQLLAYLLPDRRKKYEARYGDTWGRDIESQVNRSQAVANLIRVNLLKRLESSVHSFGLTLKKILDSTLGLIQKLEGTDDTQFNYTTSDFSSEFDDEDDEDEFTAGGKVKVDLRDIDKVKLLDELEHDASTLEQLLNYALMVTPERDEKLQTLKDFIAQKIAKPINGCNKKLLIFSAFADTANYLYGQLAGGLQSTYGMESGLVTGAQGTATTLKLKRKSYDAILAHFSPLSKEYPLEYIEKEGCIDVVFATDCISEGQNLQDCDCVVNYDIHWNPVRIIQRFGRIDRLGSQNEYVQLVNFWPAIDLDEYIKLESRVKGRMVLLDTSATGDENVLEGKRTDEMNDLTYRRDQLEQLQQEVLDLEDINGGISITDFAFDDFRVELQRYVKEHDAELETSPIGLYCVVPIPDELAAEVEPGVVFCLKQNDEDKNPKDGNPTFPYCLIYATDNGEIKTKHTQPKPALDLLRGLCAGRTEPFKKLCATFNRETGDGTKMGKYSDLLVSVLANITGTQETRGMESLFHAGEISLGSATSGSMNDYSLITFVVVK